MVIVYFLLGNLRISEPSLDILQKLKCRFNLSIMKYFPAILFFRQDASLQVVPYSKFGFSCEQDHCHYNELLSDTIESMFTNMKWFFTP